MTFLVHKRLPVEYVSSTIIEPTGNISEITTNVAKNLA